MTLDFSNVHILVLGDLMLDEYLSTSIKRISPEAPVPVANLKDRWNVAGGAANVARNLAHLGCKVSLCGLYGQDSGGDLLAGLLRQDEIKDIAYASAQRSTTRKTRIVAQGGQQLLRLDQEDAGPLSDLEYAELSRRVAGVLSSCQAVVLSDYAKGVLSITPAGLTLAQFVITRARQLGIAVCVDPKGLDWERYAGASCITPNTQEFESVIGRTLNLRSEMQEGATALMQKHGFEKILVTRSEKGMALFEQGIDPVFIKAQAKEVVDVSGAGDTVIAVLAACRAGGLAWEQAAVFANLAAGEVVSKAGTCPISKSEFDALMEPGRSSPKVLEQRDLLELVERWRRNGDRIVFTNGCFDLLHKGHILLLREAAAQGDRLIVALNSDDSVLRLKGPGRPVQDEDSRALLVSSLAGVDAVVLFDEDTPVPLLELVKPDVLVKGSDYTPETVVGADIVVKAGGSVHLVEIVDKVSVSTLVSRMQGNA